MKGTMSIFLKFNKSFGIVESVVFIHSMRHLRGFLFLYFLRRALDACFLPRETFFCQ